MAVIIVLNGSVAAIALVAGLWAASTSTGAIAGLPFAITLVGCVFQMVFHAFSYGRMLGAETIAEIGPEGVRGLSTRWEVQRIPWASISSVHRGWNSIFVRPVPGAGPKLVIPTRAVDRDATTIRAAISHFSGGRH